MRAVTGARKVLLIPIQRKLMNIEGVKSAWRIKCVKKVSVDFQVLKNFSKVNFCEIFSDEVILRNGTDQEDNVCGKLGETLPPVEAVLPPGPPPPDTALDGKFRVRCDIDERNLRERPHYRRKKDFGNFGYIPTCCIPTYCDKGEKRILMCTMLNIDNFKMVFSQERLVRASLFGILVT